MHGDVALSGPVWLFATAVILIAVMLALVVVVDSIRPLRRLRDGSRSGRTWPYALVEASFLVALAVAQFAPGVSGVSLLPVALAPIALLMGVLYLLRVVYPARVDSATADDEVGFR